MKKIIQLIITAALLAGCKNEPGDLAPADTKIAFYNASQVLRKEVEQKNQYSATKPAFILLNTKAPVKPDTLPPMDKQGYAYFALSAGGQQFCPLGYSSITTIPWMSYMRVTPGRQDISFLDTDTTLLVTGKLDIPRDAETTVFLADSLGQYRTIVTNDAHTAPANGISLRFVHAAPDTGKLRLKVNQAWLPQTWSFGEASAFADLPMADSLQSAIYRIQLSPASDTSKVLSKYVLKADRRQIYTLIANGYFDYHDETDYMAPDFRLNIFRNK
ncbi:DUF4397 domain-containing protein [Chitinophaga barathri]|uniref:DUF4397 domain-containing protein n=1 Tax=Chitinophaga barathri TaxID=1647451 RepID=A0A3N4ME43_9BACT|nr:DUF4397 domain-containing protein [Chitinophaga barathri]RPD39867.1 DUF4397 domain-containing protein [Chitinophaga barathri]